jgi:signal transduction histidine kinase
MGLTNMRRRAAALGGRLTLESAPGRGTTVRMTVPPATPAGEP